VLDEAHRVAGVGLIGRLMQECRELGIGATVSGQTVSVFSDSIPEAPRSHLCLQVNAVDTQWSVRLLSPGKRAKMQSLLQSLGKFRGVFRNEEHPDEVEVSPSSPAAEQSGVAHWATDRSRDLQDLRVVPRR